MTESVTALMCVPVMSLLPVPLQAIMRSASTVGANVFDELVALRRVDLYAEVDNFPNECEDGGTTSTTSHLWKTINAPLSTQVSNVDSTVDALACISSRKYVSRFRKISFQYLQHHHDDAHTSNHAMFLNGSFAEGNAHLESIIINCDWGQAGRMYQRRPMVDKFIYGCPKLHTVVIEDEINGFRSIGTNFLALCPLLSNVNLDGLSHITRIESDFMLNCVNIQELDITVLMRRVTSIHARFMRGCLKLRKLKMGADNNNDDGVTNRATTTTSTTQYEKKGACLEDIGDDFLGGCTNLSTLTLPPMTNVTMIGNYYLRNCSSLTEMNIIGKDESGDGLKCLLHIGFGFMVGCSNLKRLTLRGLTSITGIPSAFMQGCSRLQHLHLGGLENTRVVCDHFLAGCSSLSHFDFEILRAVKRIGPHFMDGCNELAPSTSALTTVDLTPLNRASEVGTGFLGGWLEGDKYDAVMGGGGVLSHVLIDALIESKSNVHNTF